MFSINSKNGEVKVYAITIEEEAVGQIVKMANSDLGKNAHIRIMPDAHAGAGCTIGTTMLVTDKLCPNLVGVDIGCGMLGCKIESDIDIGDIHKLDEFCRENIVSGMNVNKREYRYEWQDDLISNLRCCSKLRNKDWIMRSLGTLGGGNHFIELDKDEQSGKYWLIIHTGSRNLGKQVADIYQKIACDRLSIDVSEERKKIIQKLKEEHREAEISEAISNIKKPIATGLEYLEGEDLKNYLHDMELVQTWADENRLLILNIILNGLGWEGFETITTIHNYIDFQDNILRKGAISAKKGELCLIPLNMRDGTLLCEGKGNEDWNCSGIVKKSAVKKHPKLQETQYAAFYGVERSGTEQNAARRPVRLPAVPLPTPGI